MTKRTNRSYTAEFKQEAVALVTEQGYSVPKATASLDITDKLLYNWKAKVEAEQSGVSLNTDERAELLRLRKENKELRMEKEISKKGQRPPAKAITVEQLNLYRKAKYFFKKSRNCLGYRELRKKLRSEGFGVSDYGVQ